VILEDNKSNTPDPEAAAVSALVDASADSASKLSKLIHLSYHEAWYDIDNCCYIDKELRPVPPLEQEGLASTLVQGQPYTLYYSPRPLHNWMS